MAWARVQGGTFNNPTGSTTAAVTISAIGSGNGICGLIGFDGTSVTINSVADDQGNTYNVETIVRDAGGPTSACAFSRTNITNAPTTITVTFSASIGFRKLLVDEFSGGSTASTDERDGAAHGGQLQSSPGTGTDAITSGTFTTSNDGDLLWGGCIGPNSTTNPTAGTSFSNGAAETTDYSGKTEYRVQATAGSGTAATFTQAANTDRMTFLIALKPAGGAAPTTPKSTLMMMGV